MVHIDPKFTQLVNQQHQLEGTDPYDIDLRKDTITGSGTNQIFFSILGCEEANTSPENCGTFSGMITGCGTCG